MSVVKLGNVARESRLKWEKSKQDVPIVGLEHLVPDEIRFDAYDKNTDNTFSKKFVKGQVLFGRRRAYQRKAAVAEFDGICSGDIIVIETIDGKMVPELLPFIIQTPAFFDYANRGSAGSLSPRVKWEHLAAYEFELPSLEEQKILADKLWAAYRLKEAYKKLLVATDEMVKSQFIEMFGGYKAVTPWSEVVTITNGKVYPEEYKDFGTYPICGSGGIMYYGEKKLCGANSVILGRKGNINSPIFMESDYWIVDTAFSLDVDKDRLHPKFFYFWCCQYDFTKLNKQGVLPSLTRKDLEKVEMAIPPLDEQYKFVSIAEQADKSKFGDFKSQFIEMFENVSMSSEMQDCFSLIRNGANIKQGQLEGGIPITRIETISEEIIDRQKMGYAGIADNKYELYYLQDGDILMSHINSLKHIGKCALYNKKGNETIIHGMNLLCLRPQIAIINPVFAIHMLRSDIVRKDIADITKPAVNQASFSVKDFGKLKAIIPPMSEQLKFVAIVEQADKSKSVIQKALVYLNDIQSDELREIA